MRSIICLFALLFISSSAFAQEANPDIRNGNKAYEEKQYTQSEIDYRKALQKDNSSIESYYNLGNSLFKQEKYDEAVKEYDNAAALSEDKGQLSAIYHNKGNALYQKEKYEEAVEAYKQSLKNKWTDEETRFNLAMAQKKLQKQQQQQEQQQDKENKDKDKDKDKEEQEQQKQEEQQQEQQQEEKEKQQQQQQQEQEMSKENAEQILKSFEEDETDVREKLQQQQGTKRSLEKDW